MTLHKNVTSEEQLHNAGACAIIAFVQNRAIYLFCLFNYSRHNAFGFNLQISNCAIQQSRNTLFNGSAINRIVAKIFSGYNSSGSADSNHTNSIIFLGAKILSVVV